MERLRTYSPDLTINSLLHTPAKGLRKLQAKLTAPKAKYRQAEVELRVIAEGTMAHAIYLSGSTKYKGGWCFGGSNAEDRRAHDVCYCCCLRRA